MKTVSRSLSLCAVLLCGGVAHANDFPTLDRVLYVQECMRDHPGLYYEMVSKCTCALDALAEELSYDQYSEMSTVAKASSIGGERGGYIRANKPEQAKAKEYRQIQARVKQGCFIDTTARR